MKFLPLVWSMLWRRRTRTWLTASSIAAAFLLYGMLQAVGAVLTLGANKASADVLISSHRYGFGKPLPVAYRTQIAAVPGIRFVEPTLIVPLVYQDARTGTQPSLGIDPEFFAADPRFVVDADTLKAFTEKRSAIIAGREMAAKYGWKIGDHVPLKSPSLKRRDGAPSWDFEVVGLFHYNTDLMGEGISAMRGFVRYDYLDEARLTPGVVDLFMVHVADPAQAPAIAKQIDALFQNSANPSKTLTQAEQQRSMLAQIGDVGTIIRAILSAVFFTLVVVAGNTMMRSFRERIPDLAVLKTLGYTNGTIAVLVGLESMLLCVGAGLFGLFAAWLALKPAARAIASVLPLLRLTQDAVIDGVVLAFLLGVISAMLPVWQSSRLTIVAGLARRA